MNNSHEQQLLDLTQEITELVMGQDHPAELKEEAILSLESMSFFMSNNDMERAITEAINLVDKLKEANNE
jgi:predicted RecB family endonuclease